MKTYYPCQKFIMFVFLFCATAFVVNAQPDNMTTFEFETSLNKPLKIVETDSGSYFIEFEKQ